MSAFDDSTHSSFRIPGWFVVLCMVGGGFFFFQHYKIAGLDEIAIYPKDSTIENRAYDDGYGDLGYDATYVGLNNSESVLGSSTPVLTTGNGSAFAGHPGTFDQIGNASLPVDGNPFTSLRNTTNASPSLATRPRIRNLRIASWALSGFTPSKLADAMARRNLIRVIRQFDVVALQQITSQERDLIPRLVDAANEGGARFEFIIGEQTGPSDRQEQLAFIFDTGRVRVDRRQTYTLADPDDSMLYDPLVAWFQAAQPTSDQAWTFSFVNVRIDLGRAPMEVAMLPNMLAAIRMDGRGEDDVVLAGLFQADDEYLLPAIAGQDMRAAVRSVPTDIFGRHQTSNILMDTKITSEYIGRGGAFDFLRVYNLSAAEAELLTSHLPVFAEFTAHEGGEL
ncbi:MAG: deoxyribonuclease I [Pirellulaceae bacterium]